MYLLPARGLRHAVLFLFAIASSAPMFAQGAKVKTPGKWIEESGERREDERSFSLERQKWFMKGRQAPAGETPAGARIKAFQQKRTLRESNRQRFAAMSAASPASGGVTSQANGGGLPTSTPVFNQAWTALGPTPIGRE